MSNYEIWKPVTDFETYYEVSNQGALRRIATITGRPICRAITPHRKKDGYCDFWLWQNGNPKRVKAHRCVWTAFNGPIPSNLVINHKNGKRDDNRISNLELMTQSQNILDGFARGRPRPNNPSHGVRNGSAKLNEDQVKEIRRLRSLGVTEKMVAEQFGVSVALVSLIHRRRVWTHVPD